jgi:hypothetical protein
MLEWLRTYATARDYERTHPNYPALVEFPLQDVLNAVPGGVLQQHRSLCGCLRAVRGRDERISCFGCDFTYPNAHDAEKGRACVEFWLGMAAQMGVDLSVPKTTSLLDACNSQAQRFYGYDCVDLDIIRDESGVTVQFTERDTLPTAEEIEAAYDHTRHPNPLIED